MSQPVAHLVADTASQTLGERVGRLQAEARDLAAQHVAQLADQLRAAAATAAEISAGGDVYAPGARDVAQRLTADLTHRADTLTAIAERRQPPGSLT